MVDGVDCAVGAKNAEAIDGLRAVTVELRDTDKEQWTAINRIQNRLPIWATFVMSGLTGAIGVLITLLVA